MTNNIKTCNNMLNSSQREMTKRILNTLEPSSNSSISVFRRSAGPGLSVVIWCACGEFLEELELDCRGKVKFLLTNKRVDVMGAEIMTSNSVIGDVKNRLTRRFKIIAKCLQVMYGIERDSCEFTG